MKISFPLRSWIVRVFAFLMVGTLFGIALQACTFPGTSSSDTNPSSSSGIQSSGNTYKLYLLIAPGEGCQAESQPVIQALLEDIQNAQSKVHVAMFSFTIHEVGEALAQVKGKGVQVELVMESDNMDSFAVKKMQGDDLSIHGDNSETLMHNKFLVIDGQIVWTGSMNMTYASLCEDLNNAIRIDDALLAEKYEDEFSEMYERGLFGSDSPADPTFMPAVIDSHSPGVYFAPENQVQEQILDMIGIAQTSIEFLGYSFTADPLAEALIAKSIQGVTVRGLMDAVSAVSNTGTEYDRMRHAGLDVRQASTVGAMHHKVFIIDGQVVMLGSYNFTRRADERNDENLLVIHSPAMAAAFQAEFERILKTAKP
jgi:phosphatidylserine/phosphatidylglycerophosphate/cardiolipin synthase-like enzyme